MASRDRRFIGVEDDSDRRDRNPLNKRAPELTRERRGDRCQGSAAKPGVIVPAGSAKRLAGSPGALTEAGPQAARAVPTVRYQNPPRPPAPHTVQ
ncbi:hypothetical protein AAFF_G00419570 [Aldrovandia affinis]|uniref:Uncharacterized protein n=1 Tax=Aldrovandia affinis TaxID=143900 RepID=A0AAD7WJA7_9TELE|nr:hypothetical protein AAFF_G00419570 [Aldrovandia affinis]